MNEINAAQRKRVAAQELAEADKIKIVTAAEAEAEKDRLHGVGIVQQRKAIVERFGRYQKIATSGIHMRLPFGIDKIQLVFNYVCFKVRLWLKPKQRTMSLL